MKKLALVLAVAVLTTSVAFAQSSGNFDGAYSAAACVMNTSTGSFGTSGVCNTSSNSTDCLILDTAIKTSSGNGVTLLITPSLVTGLFTETKLTTTVTSSSADVGIQVCVDVDGDGSHVLPTPCAIYDQRFQQVSNSLFATIATCTSSCNFDLILSTLSAHSYNFFAQVPNGYHNVHAKWSVVGVATNGSASVAACAGPGSLTVTQTKIFNNSGSTLTF